MWQATVKLKKFVSSVEILREKIVIRVKSNKTMNNFIQIGTLKVLAYFYRFTAPLMKVVSR